MLTFAMECNSTNSMEPTGTTFWRYSLQYAKDCSAEDSVFLRILGVGRIAFVVHGLSFHGCLLSGQYLCLCARFLLFYIMLAKSTLFLSQELSPVTAPRAPTCRSTRQKGRPIPGPALYLLSFFCWSEF